MGAFNTTAPRSLSFVKTSYREGRSPGERQPISSQLHNILVRRLFPSSSGHVAALVSVCPTF